MIICNLVEAKFESQGLRGRVPGPALSCERAQVAPSRPLSRVASPRYHLVIKHSSCRFSVCVLGQTPCYVLRRHDLIYSSQETLGKWCLFHRERNAQG